MYPCICMQIFMFGPISLTICQLLEHVSPLISVEATVKGEHMLHVESGPMIASQALLNSNETFVCTELVSLSL